MDRLDHEDHVATLHGVARSLASPGEPRDFAILAHRLRGLADELAEVVKRTAHPERYPVNLQHLMEKKRVVNKLEGTFSEELWQRQRHAAGEELGRAPSPEETEEQAKVPGGFLAFYPLLAYDPIDQLLLASSLFYGARCDFEESCARGNSELERAKRVAAVRTMKDEQCRAMQALERWSELLEAVPVPEASL